MWECMYMHVHVYMHVRSRYMYMYNHVRSLHHTCTCIRINRFNHASISSPPQVPAVSAAWPAPRHHRGIPGPSACRAYRHGRAHCPGQPLDTPTLPRLPLHATRQAVQSGPCLPSAQRGAVCVSGGRGGVGEGPCRSGWREGPGEGRGRVGGGAGCVA